MQQNHTATSGNASTDWVVFPCHWIRDGKCSCGKECESPGKHPLTPRGLLDATADKQQQRKWWKANPQANLGLPTGEVNEIVCIDIDPKSGGSDSLLSLEEKYGLPPETWEVETGGGGLHLYYRYPAGVKITSRNGWMPGIDIKANGGYVIAPPSNHISGNKYAWAEGRAPGEIELADLPHWLLRLLPSNDKPQAQPTNGKQTTNGSRAFTLTSGGASLSARARAYVDRAEPASEGNRNDAAFRLAGHVAAFEERGERLSEPDIFEVVNRWNQRNNPPLSDIELWQCVKSALVNGTARPVKESASTSTVVRDNLNTNGVAPKIEFARISSAELASGDYQVEFAIEGAMVLGQPLTIGGPMKSLKTSILIDAAVSLGIGGYFLGRLKVKRPYVTAVMSGESGLATIQETARRIADAAGWRLADLSNLIWSPDIPKFDRPDHLEALEVFLVGDGIEVLFCDPAYLAMPSADAGNLMAQGELLRNIGDLCQRLGVSLVLCHHTKRNTGQDAHEPLELQHLAWAGHAEFARQWWLVNRRERYEPGSGQHRLWLSIGGSAGHSALWALDVDEGTFNEASGRRWEVSLTDAMGAREEKAHRKAEEKKKTAAEHLEADRKAICEAMAGFPDHTETQTAIKTATALNSSRFGPALASLIREKRILPGTIRKGNKQSYEAFTLAQS